MDMKEILNKLVAGRNLTLEETKEAAEIILGGNATDVQAACFLTALRMKGETVDEIVGCASVLGEKAMKIHPKVDSYVDIVGTGGDGSNSFNISTTSAFIIAAAGLPVAKHGNRAISSRSGAGDMLEALGLNLNHTPAEVEKQIEDVGIGFMFAPVFNPSMKYVGPARSQMGIRTVFNILGPLANPSGAPLNMIGVYNPDMTETIANVILQLGKVKRGMVFSAADYMDELSVCTETTVSEIRDGKVTTYTITPEQFGFHRAKPEDIKGGTGAENAEIAKRILTGEQGPKRDIVLLNSGMTLYVGGKAQTPEEGVQLAAEMIDSGKAIKKLEEMIAY